VADHDELAALLAHAGDFEVHLGDQRAGGVEDAQAAGLGFGAHRLGHAVGAEDHGVAGGHVGESSMKTAPLARRPSTTKRLCTTSWRT
jgi:hypothetical protein